MTIFISYSRQDRSSIDKVLENLIQQNTYVWIDTSELNAGDHISSKIRDAVKTSRALLFFLSKSSVKSKWCREELSVALMRELNENHILILPVLLEDCDIPECLDGRLYIDLVKDFDDGIKLLNNEIGRFTTSEQRRFFQSDGYLDWSNDWGDLANGNFQMRFTIVDSRQESAMTILVEVKINCNKISTKRYRNHVKAGFDWVWRQSLAEMLFEFTACGDFRILLSDQFPKSINGEINDPETGAKNIINVDCRKLGNDNGRDQIVDVGTYLKDIRDYTLDLSRTLTPEELECYKIFSRTL
jgi:TIR domain